MSNILDEGLIPNEKHVKLCERFKTICLSFSAVCLFMDLLFRMSHWPGTSIILSAGIICILLQMVACLFVKKKRSWKQVTRVTLLVLITIYFLIRISTIVDIF